MLLVTFLPKIALKTKIEPQIFTLEDTKLWKYPEFQEAQKAQFNRFPIYSKVSRCFFATDDSKTRFKHARARSRRKTTILRL